MSAGAVGTAYVRLRPNAAGFQREAQAQVDGALVGLRKSAAFLIGAGGIVEGVKAVAEAASGKQSAVAQITLAVKNAGAEWRVYGQTVEQALDKQENKSGFDFEELAQGFGRLEQQTKNSGESLRLLGTAEDVARARHLELAQVTVALSRAQAGNSQSLSRLGIIIPKYTAAQDLLKGKLADIATAEKAQTEARAKNYQGTLLLTAEQQRLAALTPVQLAQLQANVKAQEAAAVASDKRKSAEIAVGEVTRRYAGQSDAYAKTAAGSYARFRVSVQQVAEEIGGVALPQLTELANSAARVALNLSKSESVGNATKTVLGDIAGAAQAVVTAYHGLEPVLKAAAATAQFIGPGPILATLAAYKALGLVQNVTAVAEGKYQGLVKIGSTLQTERIALLEAESKAATDEVIAEEARLRAIAAQNPELTAQQVAIVANIEALTAETEALLGQTAALEGSTLATGENVIASNALTAALERQGVADAAVAAERAVGGFSAAAEGLLTKLTGPTAIIAALAVTAGAIYYISTRSSEAEQAARRLSSAYTDQATALRAAHDAATGVAQARLNVEGAHTSGEDAAAALAAAQRQLTKDQGDGHITRLNLAADERAIADAQQRVRQSDLDIASAEQALTDKIKARTDAQKAAQAASSKLIDDQLALAHAETPTGLADVLAGRGAAGGRANNAVLAQATAQAADYAVKLRDLAKNNKDLTDAQRAGVLSLAALIEKLHAVPDDKTIRLYLSGKQFEAEALTARKALAALSGTTTAHLNLDTSTFSRAIDQATARMRGFAKDTGASLLNPIADAVQRFKAPARGGASALVPDKDVLKQKGKDAAQAYTTAFVTTIDASGIKTAFTDAITQAQAQLVSEAGTLGDTIGQALDAKLKAQTLPATQEIARLQAQIAASQASVTARDTGQAVADAAKKLADLQRVFGSGALTADQSQQIAQAKVALADAQDQVGNDAKQSRIAQLQAGIDAAGKANDAAKAAASRRLADLSAELNDGLITQATYVKRLNALLAKEGVNYRSTGKLLGTAVADGFRDGLSSVLAQAKALGGLSPSALRTAKRGQAAVDPAKAEADAITQFLDSVAQSGGKFNVKGGGNLPPGITLAGLLAQAGQQRASSSYQQKSGAKADQALDYAGQTAQHGALTLAELRKLNARPIVVNVTVDGKKQKRKTAEATRS